MYERMETNEEGDITMRTVVEHIKGVEAGSGNNDWVRWRVGSSRITQASLTSGEQEATELAVGEEGGGPRGAG